ncbi:hypothetical protein ACOCG7_07515 [Paraburkholderia sp. DD10]|uniref:hypothetical protein n=1 Tax=Paraburkholderia sp. DD10 TaxID=3409691 RepID=UPI003BA07D35
MIPAGPPADDTDADVLLAFGQFADHTVGPFEETPIVDLVIHRHRRTHIGEAIIEQRLQTRLRVDDLHRRRQRLLRFGRARAEQTRGLLRLHVDGHVVEPVAHRRARQILRRRARGVAEQCRLLRAQRVEHVAFFGLAQREPHRRDFHMQLVALPTFSQRAQQVQILRDGGRELLAVGPRPLADRLAEIAADGLRREWRQRAAAGFQSRVAKQRV